MAKTVKKSKKKASVKDYNKLFKSSPFTIQPNSSPQWTSSGDYFVKFSLYKNTPSIASPNTSL